MSDPIEHDLRSLFKERVESTPHPPVPEALLGLSARPRRRGTVLAALAAVAAVAVVVVGVGIGTVLPTGSDAPPAGQTGGSTGVDEQPLSDAPTIPYIQDGVLRHASSSAATTADQLHWAGDSVIVTDNYSSQAGDGVARSWILHGNELVTLPFLDDSVVALSLDGTEVLAMSHPDPTTTLLTVHDLAQRTEVGAIDLAAPGSCCESGAVDLLGFDTSGRVFYNEGDRSFVWDPRAAEPTAITGAPGEIAQVGTQGVLAMSGDYGSSTERVLGEVNELGAFKGGREFLMPDPTEPASWSPSGHVVAYTASSGPVVEPSDASTGPVGLDVGGMVFSHVVGFESETDLLLVAREGDRNNLLRCSTRGSCDVLEEMGGPNALDDWVFPLT
ncbi:hypothetical protein [Nocardioides sp.]|uniref:hypothetical protein n=1 Tax=Nocardioides sp. TaxID=35761 RepID=UPI00286D5207|nr:hypothetical protein [Nocardioides sp.]